MNYNEFLKQKQVKVKEVGFDVNDEDLNINLFDFQRCIIKTALKKGRYAIFADCGLGKGQPEDAKILTDKGFIKYKDIKVGDSVFCSKGIKRKVIGVYPKNEIDTYRFYFSDGTSHIFDKDHLHICRTNNDRQRNKKWRVMSTTELLKSKLRYGKNGKSRNYDIPIVKPIKFKEKKLYISPYILGVLLGDGHLKHNISISSNDNEIIEKVQNELPDGVKLKHKGKYDYILKTGLTGNRRHKFRQELEDIGLLNKLSYNKFIPKKYLFNSIDNRLELLRGLMDTDGYIKDTCQFYTVSENLKNDVKFLIQSLGGIPTESIKKTSKKDCYVLTFSLKTFNPFYLSRKAKLWNENPRDNGRWIDRIEFEKKQKTVCISVNSPDSSYLIEDCIVTHNTLMQLEFARKVSDYTKGSVLILTPLAVKEQTIQEAKKFNVSLNNIEIYNYEQIDNLDCNKYAGVVLDESSILKNFTGVYKNKIIDNFKNTNFKLCCTATPAPNDLNEIGNHSEFLDVMNSGEMRE